jgi:hypothetical protein
MGQSRGWPDRKVEKRQPATWHHLVRRLLAITSRRQQTQRTLLDWLRAEYGIEKPSNKLLALTKLDSNTRVSEVKRIRGKKQPPTPPVSSFEVGGRM